MFKLKITILTRLQEKLFIFIFQKYECNRVENRVTGVEDYNRVENSLRVGDTKRVENCVTGVKDCNRVENSVPY